MQPGAQSWPLPTRNIFRNCSLPRRKMAAAMPRFSSSCFLPPPIFAGESQNSFSPWSAAFGFFIHDVEIAPGSPSSGWLALKSSALLLDSSCTMTSGSSFMSNSWSAFCHFAVFASKSFGVNGMAAKRDYTLVPAGRGNYTLGTARLPKYAWLNLSDKHMTTGRVNHVASPHMHRRPMLRLPVHASAFFRSVHLS